MSRDSSPDSVDTEDRTLMATEELSLVSGDVLEGARKEFEDGLMSFVEAEGVERIRALQEWLRWENPTEPFGTTYQLTDLDQMEERIQVLGGLVSRYITDRYSEWLETLERMLPGVGNRFTTALESHARHVLAYDLSLSPNFIMLRIRKEIREMLRRVTREARRDIYHQKWGHLGILHRRSFDHYRDLAIQESARSFDRSTIGATRAAEDSVPSIETVNHPLSQGFIDIDHFGHFNDTYGEDAGDVVLEQVFGLIATTVRDTDIAAIYGGEEIVVFMPNTDEDGALIAMEKVRERVEETSFRVPAHCLANHEGDLELAPGEITISIGVDTANSLDFVPGGDVSDEERGREFVMRRGGVLSRLDRQTDRAMKAAKTFYRDGEGRLVIEDRGDLARNQVVAFSEIDDPDTLEFLEGVKKEKKK